MHEIWDLYFIQDIKYRACKHVSVSMSKKGILCDQEALSPGIPVRLAGMWARCQTLERLQWALTSHDHPSWPAGGSKAQTIKRRERWAKTDNQTNQNSIHWNIIIVWLLFLFTFPLCPPGHGFTNIHVAVQTVSGLSLLRYWPSSDTPKSLVGMWDTRS